MKEVVWHTKTVEETLLEYDTPIGGLSSAEAENRLAIHGKNKLVEPDKSSAILRFSVLTAL